MEIKLKIDTPAAKIDFAFVCSEAETQLMLNDPVYQGLGEVVIEQIRLSAQNGHWRDMRHQQFKKNNHRQ